MPAVSVRMLAYAWDDHVTSRTCLLGEIVSPTVSHWSRLGPHDGTTPQCERRDLGRVTSTESTCDTMEPARRELRWTRAHL
jgi:hypothetical protein